MRIAITAKGPTVDDEIDPRFGRAGTIITVDTEAGETEAHDNTQNLSAAQGAGIQTARRVVELGAEVILTGNVGPKAFATLQAAGVAVCVGAAGSVGSALEQYRSGQLKPTVEANVEGHWM